MHLGFLKGEDNLMSIKDKVAIITGGAAGNGKAIAKGLALAGSKVVLFDVKEDEGKKVADEIKETGAEALSITGDVSDRDDVSNLVKATIDRFGKIDVLVNNAGIFTKNDFLEFLEDDFDRTIRINLKGVYLCGQLVASAMKENKIHGSIINISSINGGDASVRPSAAGYASSKAAVATLTRVMAVDLAKYSIRVNAIAPGYFKTDMVKGLLGVPEYLKEITDNIPMGYIASPEQMVGPVKFLASNESSYVTGVVLPVDGGWLAYK